MTSLLPNQRSLFDIPNDVTYLNCAYIAPLPRAVRASGEAAVGRKSQPWRIHPQDFFTESEQARTHAAALIGSDSDGVAIIPSVSYGIAIAAANLDVAAGQRIVILEDQFPSNVYQWRDVAQRVGATVVTVPRPADHDWTSAVLSHIDARTALVAAPNCHWMDGSLVDLPRLGERARAAGAALVVDATQSLGAYPLDVAAVQPDFLVAATYKWLLGPSGLAFLYAAPHRRAGRPIEFGWLNRAGSENFRTLTDYRDEFQPGARRYDMGERSNWILLPMIIAALQLLLDWGVPSIERSLRALTDEVERRATALGLEAVPGGRRGGHMIGLRLPAGQAVGLAQRLEAEGIFVSVRGDSMRVSPHLYNSRADIERLFAVLMHAVA
jgi:selenocysteine lyase/cysteine desulfurase